MSDMYEVRPTPLHKIAVKLSTVTDEERLNEYLDNVKEKVIATWSDVSVDYSSIDEYVSELLDNNYLFDSGIVKIVTDVINITDVLKMGK